MAETAEVVENDPHPDVITPRAILVVLVATLATASYAFTWNSVTVALPHMKGTFSATTDQITWVMTAYIVASAIATASVSWNTAAIARIFTPIATICSMSSPLLLVFRKNRSNCSRNRKKPSPHSPM